ncbi:hypothetical protein LJC61_03875 [Ruminococcaceae bacterium OttesenSCG-928-A16]|nr:hypothetical protein [Ruminococcaceae bacterium OttesenSCG-928-A16]
MKTGIFAKKVSTYAVGFSASDKEMVVVPLDSDGNSGDPIVLPKTSITAAKMDLQGGAKIKSDMLKDELRFTVPPYTPTTLEEVYILPVIQEEVAAQFKAFIKENF